MAWGDCAAAPTSATTTAPASFPARPSGTHGGDQIAADHSPVADAAPHWPIRCAELQVRQLGPGKLAERPTAHRTANRAQGGLLMATSAYHGENRVG